MKKIIVLENLRSAYNVGNILRTADALGWRVVTVGYTPSPVTQPKVVKTSLGAEKNVYDGHYFSMQDFFSYARVSNIFVVSVEIAKDLPIIDLKTFSQQYKKDEPVALIFGNEVTGIEKETLEISDAIVYVPMQGEKESLNVGQTAAICMWELGA